MPLEEAKWTFEHLQEVAEALEVQMRARGNSWVIRANDTDVDIGDYTYFFAFNFEPKFDNDTFQNITKEEYM